MQNIARFLKKKNVYLRIFAFQKSSQEISVTRFQKS